MYTIISAPPAGSREPGALSVLCLCHMIRWTHLELNLGLSNILLAAAAAGNLLGFRDLTPDSLRGISSIHLGDGLYIPYLCAEVLQRVGLHSVDAELRAGLHNGESSRQEELLGATILLDNLNQAGLQLLDRGYVVRQDAHLTGFRREVDLDAAL